MSLLCIAFRTSPLVSALGIYNSLYLIALLDFGLITSKNLLLNPILLNLVNTFSGLIAKTEENILQSI